ncbi:MAG: trimethylamine methyltransferase family protein [Ignavibacteriales bacterium]
MARIGAGIQPRLRILQDEDITRIHDGALDILEKAGVMFRSAEAVKTLASAGATVDFHKGVTRFPRQMVLDCVEACPSSVQLFTTDGRPAVRLEGNEFHYAPGSTALKMGDGDGREAREATSSDLRDIVRLVDKLPHIHLQSTAVVVSDAPREIGDLYRLYIVLKNSSKPVITGAFSVRGLTDMKDMLAGVAGGEAELAAKPMAIFDVCPSPPLMWTEISTHNIMDCARYGLPVEFISMPLSGANAPATIAGSVVQHTAETLSGIVLAQVIRKGTPVVYGGAPSFFEMRFGTTPMGSIETMMVDMCYAQMGKFYGLPTHTYSATTDSKLLDMQAGLESSLGSVLCALGGVNVISGPGMYDFLTCQSLLKLVVDNEICGMVYRLMKGADTSGEALAVDVIESAGPGADYLSSAHTLKYFKREQYVPGPVIDRRDRKNWSARGGPDMIAKAGEVARKILASPSPSPLPAERADALDRVVRSVMRRYGIEGLPLGPES